jgi:hypothetical protein
MCTEQSKPIMEVIVVDKPTMTAVPVLLQPPPFENSVKTAFALLRGASTHNGMMMAKRPTI